MIPRIPSIRKSSLFYTSQRARIEWVNALDIISTKLTENNETKLIISPTYKVPNSVCFFHMIECKQKQHYKMHRQQHLRVKELNKHVILSTF